VIWMPIRVRGAVIVRDWRSFGGSYLLTGFRKAVLVDLRMSMFRFACPLPTTTVREHAVGPW